MTYEALRIGEKLITYRKLKGLSQEQLAERIKVTRQAISKWERDEAMPDLLNLKYLAMALEFSIDELLKNDTPNKFIKTPDGTSQATQEATWDEGQSAFEDSATGLGDQDNENPETIDKFIYNTAPKHEAESEWWADAIGGSFAILCIPAFILLNHYKINHSWLVFFSIPVMYGVGKALPTAISLFKRPYNHTPE